MSLVFCGLAPHPPLLVPEIGGELVHRVDQTRRALEQLSAHIVALAPETLVIVTPHGPVRPDALSMTCGETLRVGFQGFSWDAELEGDAALEDAIARAGRDAGFPVVPYPTTGDAHYPFTRGLDHASMVVLYYLRAAGLDCRVVVISVASWSHRDHFEFGRVLHPVLEDADARVALLASGDLSHRLTPAAPAGYAPEGVDFDRRVVRDLETFDTVDLLALDDAFVMRIGECGLRPIGLMFGVLQERETVSRVLSYEGPFGVGYCVASLDVAPRARVLPLAPATRESEDEVARAVLSLARDAVDAFVRGGVAPALPERLPLRLRERGAAFVCLKKDGVLRGCIGTVEPTQPDLAHELVRNAAGAASRDPRFVPVAVDELADLTVSVDVLDAPEPVATVDALDPKIYGVIVREGRRTGVLLPGLEGIETPERQVELACLKAGIDAGRPVALMRFQVRRYEQGG